MTDKPRERVSIDAEAWNAIDQILVGLPYRKVASVVAVIQQTGGVVPLKPDDAAQTAANELSKAQG